MVNNKDNMTFKNVIITNWKDRTDKYICDTIEGYKEHLKINPDMAELIGGPYQQIKPIFDIDAYETEPDINKIISDINSIFPNKPINYAKRDPREYKGKIKYSYQFYVDNVRITSKNLKSLLIKYGLDKKPIYDLSIYDSNKILFLPFTTKKTNGDTIPALIPVNCDIFDCCASYIKEEYEDWDKKAEFDMVPFINKKITKKEDEDIKDGDDNEDNDKYLKLQKLIKLLKENRSSNFDSWIKCVWCIINICNKEDINEKKTNRLIHQFSAIAKKDYDEDKVDEWIDKNIDRINETGYG